MNHDKKDKGDIAVAKTIADLTVKGYSVFIPVITEHLPFDIIAYQNGNSYRIQTKYSINGSVKNKTSWSDKNGTHSKYYASNDFDYYAIYLPQIDKVIYPSIEYGGSRIRTTIPNSATPFYWWEDFLVFTKQANKKTYRHFGKKLIR